MAVDISIIGMGQIGASIGLALAGKTELVNRTGHDRNLNIARIAEKKGALDKVEINLQNAVRQADLVVLALPVDQIRETLAIIGPELKEAAVVMDTAPVKEAIVNWARELLPEGRYYVGLTPVINPAYLQTHESGVEAAHEDLFKGGMMAIVVPPSTPSEAIKLAADLTRLLGSTPLFADPVEIDGLMAATHILPQLLAAALLNVTLEQPGWREGRKLAGRAYAEVTGPVVQLGEAGALSSAAMLSRENVIRMTDSLIAALQAFRADLKNEAAGALSEKLERARAGRELWWSQRQKADWLQEGEHPVEMPRASDMFGRMLGLGKKPKK